MGYGVGYPEFYGDVRLLQEKDKALVQYSQAYTKSLQGRECFDCGAFVPTLNIGQHDNFHKTFSNRKGDDVSSVAWCDFGGHAFKKSEPGAFHGSIQVNDENGHPRNEETDGCSQHNPMRARPEVIAKELNTAYPTAPVNAISSYPNDVVPD